MDSNENATCFLSTINHRRWEDCPRKVQSQNQRRMGDSKSKKISHETVRHSNNANEFDFDLTQNLKCFPSSSVETDM